MASLSQIAAFLLALVTVASSPAFAQISTSGDVFLKEGEQMHLTCNIPDTEYFLCTWHNMDTGKKCTKLFGSLDGAHTCQNEDGVASSVDRVSFDESDPTTCQMLVDDITAEDAGQYRCTFIYYVPGEDSPSSELSDLAVEVASPSTVSFTGELALPEDAGDDPMPYMARAGEPIPVECAAAGGSPAPAVSAWLGGHMLMYMEGEDSMLESTSDASEETLDDVAGTVVRTSYFEVVPSVHDCGKYITCQSEQFESEESEDALFASAASRKIMVHFPPQPLAFPLGPFGFVPGAESVRIDVMFMANPVPADNQAIWHVDPSLEDADPSHDSVVFEAGQSADRFEGLPLNTTGHEVTASIVIYNPQFEDTEKRFSLRVVTVEGENTYAFTLTTEEQTEFESTKPDFEEPEADEAGVSTGTIVGIVLVVLLIALIALFIFWAKAKDRLCFKKSSGGGSSDGHDSDSEHGNVGGNTEAEMKKDYKALNHGEAAPLKDDDERPEADKRASDMLD